MAVHALNEIVTFTLTHYESIAIVASAFLSSLVEQGGSPKVLLVLQLKKRLSYSFQYIREERSLAD